MALTHKPAAKKPVNPALATFNLALGQSCTIKLNGARGVVSARCEYDDDRQPCYLVEYADAQGNFKEEWFYEHKLNAA